jgi:hypothetical protein
MQCLLMIHKWNKACYNKNMVQKSPPYQILEIKENWIVTYNQFYNVCPQEVEDHTQWDCFSDCMLIVENICNELIVKLGWLPARRPGGTFHLKVYWGKLDGEMILESRSSLKEDIVDRINWLLNYYN